MTAGPRAVRIPRRSPGPAPPTRSMEPAEYEFVRSDAHGAARPISNDAGRTRAFRLFVLFLVALLVLYGAFIAEAAASAPAVRSNSAIYASLTGVVAVALVVGWLVTLGPTPRSAWVDGSHLVVRESLGRLRRFDLGPGFEVRTVRSQRSSPLSPEPTEYAEVSASRGPRRTYLVGQEFFEFVRARPSGD